MPVDITVIVLTYNEEANLAQALESVVGWASRVVVFDSFSSDATVEIAKRYECTVLQNAFVDYGKQRNAALDAVSVETEWCFFLDADEWLPEDLKAEIGELVLSRPAENAFFVAFRLMWMGRWIRRGYYPTWVLRMFRAGKARCEDRSVNEHLRIEGAKGYLKHAFIHEDRKSVGRWIEKHNRYASQEADELLRGEANASIDVNLFGTQAERKRWIRLRVWNRLPPLVRPPIYFAYRYFGRGGFLDGREALVFHFLQALWFPMLIDIKYLEGVWDRYGRPARERTRR